MKKVLFIGITEYNLRKSNPHLQKKFEGLSRAINVFVISRGGPFHKRIWGCDFYLIAARTAYPLVAFVLGSYLCFLKKIDTIVCQGPLTEGVIGVLLKFIFRKELIIEIHGDWREGPFLNKKRLFAPILRKTVPIVGLFVLGKAEKIRTLTRLGRDEIRAKFPDKHYFVFPTFTDIDIFLAEKNTRMENYVVTVAVLSPIKNIETLIAVFVSPPPLLQNFRLVIVGDGPSRESLKLEAENKKLGDSIVFTGRLPLDKVKNIMKDCYVFVLPSLSEGFGRVFIEAMALGKPVIGSNVGGIPEIIKDGENGFLIEPKDAAGLTAKLEYLISNPDVARSMGRIGQKFVQENFSNEKYIRNYIDMINA